MLPVYVVWPSAAALSDDSDSCNHGQSAMNARLFAMACALREKLDCPTNASKASAASRSAAAQTHLHF